ncbi:hypothetical protein LEL_10949 [Akanthomyces lecanii RCEF 1005]|uniref:Uncharacterized protein n=1 Tax=Akanthomyces lecanii RCEF 1005 TaxID=1081108 RepID=A0A162IGA2_CORDF|nr:hypothetical protein LEL_10949 [Akanthomyces lecanii RCEF 1005]
MGSYPTDPPDTWLDIAEVTPVSPPVTPNGSESTSDDKDHGDHHSVHCTLLFDDIDRGMTVERFWSAVQAQLQQDLEPIELSAWMEQAYEQIEQDLYGHPLSSILPYVGSSLGTPAGRWVQNGTFTKMSALHASTEVEMAVRRCENNRLWKAATSTTIVGTDR